MVLKARTATTDATARDTLKSDLLQKAQTMVNDLRSQYQDFYVYGGNDVSTPPFSLSADGTKLTFSHKFPGETDVTNFEMELKKNGDNYEFELLSGTGSDGKQLGDINKLVQAMSEHGA